MATCRLVLEDEDLAAWTGINNDFACKKQRKDEHWPIEQRWGGVFIQLGRYKKLGSEALLDGFVQIEIRKDDEPVLTLTKGDFEQHLMWINVVANPRGRPEPMGVDDLDRLLVTERPRSLHHLMQPYRGAVTLWPETGYTVKAERGEGTDENMKYTFEFDTGGDFRVEVYRDLASAPESVFLDVDEIVVHPSVTHRPSEISDDALQRGFRPGGVSENPPQRELSSTGITEETTEKGFRPGGVSENPPQRSKTETKKDS